MHRQINMPGDQRLLDLLDEQALAADLAEHPILHPVGDAADAADAKTSAQPVDDRQQGSDIAGVAGPQLAAQRPAVLIHDQPDDHLMEIRAVVFRMAATTKLLAAPSLEGQAGGVHEDDAEFGEQVAPTGKQPLFHEVLAAARRQLAGCGLIGERLAEPSHWPVEMTARNDPFLAPEIGDDALLGATLLAYVLDQVDVGVGANALVASEHTLSI